MNLRYPSIFLSFAARGDDMFLQVDQTRGERSLAGYAMCLLVGGIVGVVVVGGCSGFGKQEEGAEPKLGEASKKRLVEERRRATYQSARRAGVAADDNPDDLRAQRKAAELAITALRVAAADAAQTGRALYSDEEIVGWVENALKRLRNWDSRPCRTRLEAGRVYEVAEMNDRAAKVYIASVEECNSAEAAILATRPLRVQERCDRAVKLIASVWPPEDADQEVPLLDAVNRCSSEVGLRKNLSFVSESVVEDYFDLLEERKERAEERRERARRQRREREREREKRRRQQQCRQHCRSSYSSCLSGCPSGDHDCRDQCRSRRESCFAGCY